MCYIDDVIKIHRVEFPCDPEDRPSRIDPRREKMAIGKSIIESAHDQKNVKDYSKNKLFEGYKFDQEGFEKLFHDLDLNKDGRIGVDELSDGLKRLGVQQLPGQAQVKLSFLLVTYHKNDCIITP